MLLQVVRKYSHRAKNGQHSDPVGVIWIIGIVGVVRVIGVLKLVKDRRNKDRLEF